MTDSNDPTPAPEAASVPPPYGAPAPDAVPAPAPGMTAMAPMPGLVDGPVGKVRSTGTCVLLTIVTLGFYTWYWYYKTHDEMKRHSGNGVGGGIALLLAILVGIVMPFISSNEVGGLYERKGRPKPVSAATGLWYLLLGWFFLVGAIVWFVKTNGALNEYWKSQGAQG
ncbi:DUF4234 domain-containing protein [Nocardioides mangrovi]|uniref:DUF4234 domain-containing protein n=1 Tax=Nocardioides mangrovi TaxID=2874580 RepID=A0ABS7U9J0_9ACTN|nr:DUF4234 domain-containing protein [Nocardioides mangrovi]MBZ5737644.1 DUF4234 domain-containing protein [Nocardioides mangrovi]